MHNAIPPEPPLFLQSRSHAFVPHQKPSRLAITANTGGNKFGNEALPTLASVCPHPTTPAIAFCILSCFLSLILNIISPSVRRPSPSGIAIAIQDEIPSPFSTAHHHYHYHSDSDHHLHHLTHSNEDIITESHIHLHSSAGYYDHWALHWQPSMLLFHSCVLLDNSSAV